MNYSFLITQYLLYLCTILGKVKVKVTGQTSFKSVGHEDDIFALITEEDKEKLFQADTKNQLGNSHLKHMKPWEVYKNFLLLDWIYLKLIFIFYFQMSVRIVLKLLPLVAANPVLRSSFFVKKLPLGHSRWSIIEFVRIVLKLIPFCVHRTLLLIHNEMSKDFFCWWNGFFFQSTHDFH